MAVDNRLQVFDEQGNLVDYDILASDVKFLPDGKDLPTKLDEMEEEIGEGGYTPPDGGIPKADLAQSVQTSLDKADTALQQSDKTALQAAITSLQNALNTLIGGNVQGAIDTFNEVTAFLNGIDTSDPTLKNQLLALNTAITNLQTALADKANAADLATVATSGSYNDLSNKPTILSQQQVAGMIEDAIEDLPTGDIPTKVSELDNDEGYVTAQDVAGVVAANGDLVIIEDPQYINIVIQESSIAITPEVVALHASQKSATIKVSGSHLKADINISVPQGFTATPSTIQQVGGVVAETNVVIAYTGADASTASGNITATSGDTTKDIPLTYTQYAGPTIIADDSAITFKAGAGSTQQKTLVVQGVNLEAGITAAISGTNAGKFSVSPASISQSGGTASGALTIIYSPAAGDSGTHTATLTLSSSGASKVITLNGAVSTITVSTNSLSLSAEQGGSATGTFTIEGANLNEDISISASGTGFSVSPQTIAHSNGSVASTTVTVTYSPSTAGSHSGSISIQSSGVTKTITLQGTVVETPNFTSANNYRLQVNGIYYDVMMSNNAPTTDLRVNNSSYSGNAAANSYSGDIVIPSTINGKLDGVATTFTVKDIRTHALSNCSSLNSVVVPDTVTAIHDYAFYDSALKRLVIGNGLTGFTIGNTVYKNVIGGTTVLDVADFGTSFMDFGDITNIIKMSANGKVYIRWTGSRVSGGNTYYHAKAEYKPFKDASGNLPSGSTLYVPSGKVANYQGSNDWLTMFGQNNIVAIDE